MPAHAHFAKLIWQIADLLRGPYRPPQYERVMLPMTVLRRFDGVLAASKAKVLAEHARLKGSKVEAALADLSGHWIDRVQDRRPPRGIVLDMDSSVSPTHGEQEMSVWNGHYQSTCYHPLFVFNQFGDLERCALRPGNIHSADGWEAVL